MLGKTKGYQRHPERSPYVVAIMLFVVIFCIYLVNPNPVWSGDMNSNSIFAFNIFEFRTVYLDGYANSNLATSFNWLGFYKSPASNWSAGHYVSAFPVGAAVVTLPLYALFYVYMKLFVPAVSFMTADFEPYRIAFLHISGAFVSAATVVLFYLCSRERFPARVALFTSLCLAFATMQWGFLSQSIMQHGPSSFVVMAATYLLIRADASGETRARTLLLFSAGSLTGLLFLVRPTNLVFMLALLAFVIIWFPRRVSLFAIGLLITSGTTIVWNYADFGTVIGSGIHKTDTYNFSIETFLGGIIGLLVSPIRGVIPNSPFLLFAIVSAIPVLRRVASALAMVDVRKTDASEVLFCALLCASGVLFVSYSFSPFWSGGSYGSRYVSETMPFIAYFLNYLPLLRPAQPGTRGHKLLVTTFGLLVGVGVFNQITAIVGGHQGLAEWGNTPVSELDTLDGRRWAYMTESPLRVFETKLWNFRDGMNERIWRGVYYSNFVFPRTEKGYAEYRAGCSAYVVNIDGIDQTIPNTIEVIAIPTGKTLSELFWNQFNTKRKFVRAKVHNNGSVPLYGYTTGILIGRATIVHQVVDENGATIYENGTVYISGVIHPGQTGDALGILEAPLAPGRYGVNFKVAIHGLGFCGSDRLHGTVLVSTPPK
jgi:hypothetical protein